MSDDSPRYGVTPAPSPAGGAQMLLFETLDAADECAKAEARRLGRPVCIEDRETSEQVWIGAPLGAEQ